MNKKEKSWQYLFAGALSALLLAAITVFALKPDAPKDSVLFVCLADILLQIGFGISCLWTLKASDLLTGIESFVDHGSPSLRSIAAIAPWLVVLQIVMGATLRYRLMGAISHVLGAMLVGAFLLYFATGVMVPAPKQHPARSASIVLLWIVLVQVVLGIAAYVVRFGQGENNGLPDTRLFSIAHILTGAILLGTTTVASSLVRASSRKQEVAGLPSTGTV
jgi:hypothetical protein